MVNKEELRLGQMVRYGRRKVGAKVDALTQDSCGLVLDGGRYVRCSYEDVYYDEEESGR